MLASVVFLVSLFVSYATVLTLALELTNTATLVPPE